MRYRITVFTYCLVGCVIAALVSFLLHLKFNVPLLAYLIFCTLIVFASYAGGLRNKKTLVMIGIYASIGFAAAGMARPVIVVSPRNQEAWEARKPLGGKEEFVACVLLGSVFALGRCAFLRVPARNYDDERVSNLGNPV